MTVNCYYAGFGAVHSIEFAKKDELIWRSGTINQRLTAEISNKYTYENVQFYFLANYIAAFFKKHGDVKKINIYTSNDMATINDMIKNPHNESEKYLSQMVNEKKITFDIHGDALLYKASQNVFYAYFDLKSQNKTIKFGNGCHDPFDDMCGDRYNIYN